MPWAVFTRTFNYDFRPRKAVSRIIRVSDEPQQHPEHVIAAAVAAGAARQVTSPTASQKRALTRAKRAG